MSLFRQHRGFWYGRHAQHYYPPYHTFNPRGAATQFIGNAAATAIAGYVLPGTGSENLRGTKRKSTARPPPPPKTEEPENPTTPPRGNKLRRQPQVKRLPFPNSPPAGQATNPVTPRMPIMSRYAAKGKQFSNTPNDGEDVPVVPPPAKVSKIIPDYTTIKLTYHDHECLQLTEGNWNSVAVLRLNGILDPTVNRTSHQPMGFAHWIQSYKYYRVLETDVQLNWQYVVGYAPDIDGTLNNEYQSAGLTNVCSMSAMVGYEFTDDATDVYNNARYMIEGKHSKVGWLHPKDFEIQSVAANNQIEIRTAGGDRELSVHYSPDQWDQHVHELGLEERWTAVSANPDILHFLAVHTMSPGGPNERMGVNSFITIRLDYNISYTVQFREIQASFKTGSTTTV